MSFCPLVRQYHVVALAFSLGMAVHYPASAACSSTHFIRGDADCDGQVVLTDGILVLNFLFGRGALPCLDAADADDDGKINVTDAVRIFRALFSGLGPLPLPYPSWGEDQTWDALGCGLGAPSCTGDFRAEHLGDLSASGAAEPSGIALSRVFEGILWIANDADSRRDRRLHAVRPDGSRVSTLRLCLGDADCRASESLDIHTDWEGMALGADTNASEVVYIADIGNNRTPKPRTRFWIHRVPVTDPRGAGNRDLKRDAGEFDTLFIEYPGSQPRDAEVLLRDPVTGRLFVVDVDGNLFRYPGSERPGENVVLELVGTIEHFGEVHHFPSGGDVSPHGRWLILKSGYEVRFFPWDPEETQGTPVAGPPCGLDLRWILGFDEPFFHAGAVCFDSDTSFVSLEERGATWVFRISFPAEE
jgi:hypothetical protein